MTGIDPRPGRPRNPTARSGLAPPAPSLAVAFAAALVGAAVACTPPDVDETTSAGVVHLIDRLPTAQVESGGAVVGASLTWDLSDPGSGAQLLSEADMPVLAKLTEEPIADAVRLSLATPDQRRSMLLFGGFSFDLSAHPGAAEAPNRDGGTGTAEPPTPRLGDWATVEVRARSNDRFGGITVAHNFDEEGALPGDMAFFFSTDEVPPVFNDGSEQIYSIPLRPRATDTTATPLRNLAIVVGAPDEASIDLLSVTLVPRGAAYREDFGSLHVQRDGLTRRTLYAHTPSRLRFPVDVPERARLDVGLAVESGESIRYRVRVEEGVSATEELGATIKDESEWAQRQIDLSAYAGRKVDLILEADSDRAQRVALWGAPILSAGGPAVEAGAVANATGGELPNVIFYVIDGAGADLMSVYGYDRSTTPFLEELAAEGVVFERAYSNSTWTQPSTASFMTSLHHSVLGGLRRGLHSTPIPIAATTMAEHMTAAGYQTASFTANPNAGRIIGNERGVDLLSDANSDHHSTSSVELHELFWQFRDSYPGAPYWVHFQTTDVHEPNEPEPPFAGRIVDAADREQLSGWDRRIFQVAWQEFGKGSIQRFYDVALERAEIDRQRYFSTRKGLYDETMLHQDEQLRGLVARLKDRGEWENTLLIIGSDHGHPAGTFARFGRGLLDPQPPLWEGALFDAYATRVPLIFVWPGRIEGGRRIEQAVSMIDVLPTLLDLIDRPQPEILQGQSLAELLRGGEVEARPVIFDEFRVDDESGLMIGNLEMIDGRWGASLEIGPLPEGSAAGAGRHTVPIGGRWGARHEFHPTASRLLLYDLEADPFATRAVNEEHPELVDRYRNLLAKQWRAHQALATRFEETSEIALSPEQLKQLRSLGYIQ